MTRCREICRELPVQVTACVPDAGRCATDCAMSIPFSGAGLDHMHARTPRSRHLRSVPVMSLGVVSRRVESSEHQFDGPCRYTVATAGTG